MRAQAAGPKKRVDKNEHHKDRKKQRGYERIYEEIYHHPFFIIATGISIAARVDLEDMCQVFCTTIGF